MSRKLMIVLGTVLGFVQGMVFFVIVGFSIDDPFRTLMSGELLDYPVLVFGGVGAICGAVLGWALPAWTTANIRGYVSVPRTPSKPGDPPYKGPFG